MSGLMFNGSTEVHYVPVGRSELFYRMCKGAVPFRSNGRVWIGTRKVTGERLMLVVEPEAIEPWAFEWKGSVLTIREGAFGEQS